MRMSVQIVQDLPSFRSMSTQQAVMDCEVITVKAEACKDTPEHLGTWKGESVGAEKGAAGLCGKKGLYCTES